MNVADPKTQAVNNLADLEAVMPGKVKGIVQWFETYKEPDGKPKNRFLDEGKPRDAEYAMKVIEKTHKMWQNKANMKAKGLWVPDPSTTAPQ